jgi:hypothetical protein
MKDLVKEISDLFYKDGPLSKKDLKKLRDATTELANSTAKVDRNPAKPTKTKSHPLKCNL